mgnify:CR=1 FL=1
MFLIIGLGNPGKEYEKTRHNIGFLALDFLAKNFDAPKFRPNPKFKASISEINYHDNKIILAKPQTYMNTSGDSVQTLANFYKITSQNIIVIHDELDLPFSSLRVKTNGSSAGHNGIKDIINKLGTDQFIRIRLGIQTDKSKNIPAEKFVLSHFSITEKIKLKNIFSEVLQEIKKII